MAHALRVHTFLIVFLLFVSHLAQACSIVGYVGNKPCKKFLEEGLARLEYRGYDSAGIALLDGGLITIKAEGKLEKLQAKIRASSSDGMIGIGHTRWATHGPAVEVNAHPHTDCDDTIAVVHNGIIDNHFQLRQELDAHGHTVRSQTDTEVIPHILEECIKKHATLREAMVAAVARIKGTYALVGLLAQMPHTLVVARKSSPICIGIGDDETFVASDFLAFAGKTNKVIFLPDETFALVTKRTVEVFHFDGSPCPVQPKTVAVALESYEKLQYEHFMLKEIYEQKRVMNDALEYYRSLGKGLWKQLGVTPEYARQVKSIHLFGCGTSWHAARIAQFFFETVCAVPVSVHLASEFRYMPFFNHEHSLSVGVSQSGETADTLEALRLIKSYKAPIIALTNVPSSALAREADGCLLLKAGPEIAVASTKAFTAQVAALYWLAHALALEKGMITQEGMAQAERDLAHAAQVLEDTIEKYKFDVIQQAKKYVQAKRFMYLGRHIGYPFAMEGALKLKEISYIFAQGYPAGELKHGSIALIDTETPTIIFSHLDPVLYQKLLANAQEVKARKGYVIAFAFEGQDELIKLADEAFVFERVAPLLEPIAMAGLMQFFAYQIARELGRDIDKPRNLAKSVTVE